MVDALDLGSSDFCRVGSSPSARTKYDEDKEIKHKDKLTIEWDITLPAKSIDEVLEIKYNDLKNKVNIPGFRPGKVPINIIKKRYSQNVLSETLDKLINESLTKAVKERNLKPSIQPKVDIKKYEEGKDLEFNATFQLMPEIPDFELKNISVERSKLKIEKKDIDRIRFNKLQKT